MRQWLAADPAPSSGSSNSTTRVVISPWLRALEQDYLADTVLLIGAPLLMLSVVLFDILRPHFVQRVPTGTEFKRLSLGFRIRRTVSWVALCAVHAAQVMSRAAVYFVVATTANKLGFHDEIVGGFSFHWLIFASYLVVFPVSTMVSGFVVDYRWEKLSGWIFVALNLHALACFVMGFAVIRYTSFSPNFVVAIFCIGYMLLCVFESFIKVMIPKMIANWYPTQRERTIMSSLLLVFSSIEICMAYPVNALIFEQFELRFESILFTCAGLLIMLSVCALGIRFIVKPEYDLEYFALRISEYEYFKTSKGSKVTQSTNLLNMWRDHAETVDLDGPDDHHHHHHENPLLSHQPQLHEDLHTLKDGTEVEHNDGSDDEGETMEDDDTALNTERNLTHIHNAEEEELHLPKHIAHTHKTPLHIIRATQADMNPTTWPKFLRNTEFLLNLIVVGMFGFFLHDHHFLWTVNFVGKKFSQPAHMYTIIVTSLGGMIMVPISLFFTNLATLNETYNFLPSWQILTYVAISVGIMGFYLVGTEIGVCIFVTVYVLGREGANALRYAAMLTNIEFAKAGRVSAMFYALTYMFSAIASVLYFTLGYTSVSLVAWAILLGVAAAAPIVPSILLQLRKWCGFKH